MDAHTGEILAYTSLPDFDPNEFQKDSPQIDPSSLTNRPVTAAYEPGSVFKIFSLSSLLDLGAITPQDTFNAPGVYEKKLGNGDVIRIRDLAPYGIVTPQQIIEFSSNVGAAYASDKTDNESFYRMLSRFGFGKPTGIPLQGETAGLFKPVSQWSARSKPTIAMGQEVAVSAMQVMAAATAITNGGVLLKPQLVRKIVSPQGVVVKEFGREPLWEVISPDSARTMLDWMETATWPAGTAHRAAIEGVRISAKTGTAQVANPKTGTYSAEDFVASMMGIFPTEDPRYIVYVAILNPRGQSYYGSQIAAPIFRSVALGIIDKVGIPRAGMKTVAPPLSPRSPSPCQSGTPCRISKAFPRSSCCRSCSAKTSTSPSTAPDSSRARPRRRGRRWSRVPPSSWSCGERAGGDTAESPGLAAAVRKHAGPGGAPPFGCEGRRRRRRFRRARAHPGNTLGPPHCAPGRDSPPWPAQSAAGCAPPGGA